MLYNKLYIVLVSPIPLNDLDKKMYQHNKDAALATPSKIMKGTFCDLQMICKMDHLE